MQNDVNGLYEKYLAFTDQMLIEHSAMETAAVMIAISMSMYRTSMSETDYNKIVDAISDNRSRVKTFSIERNLQ